MARQPITKSSAQIVVTKHKDRDENSRIGRNGFPRVTVSRDRLVAYLPLLTLLPGLGSFGTNKTQALFAGVEYLENEPSSSEADVRGIASKRQVPDSVKETFP